MKSDLAISMVSGFAAGYSRLVGKTSHWDIRGAELVRDKFRKGENLIFAFWHNRFTMMPFIYEDYFHMNQIAVIVSQSQDGELVGRFIQRFKFKAIRGSSSRGGKQAMLNLMRTVRNGWNVALTPDGPRGPRYQVQDGIITLASVTGVPIMPVSYSSSLRFIFRASWDHFRLPLPGSRMKLVFGEPLPIGKHLKDQERSDYREELRRRLRQADHEAEVVNR